MAEKGVITLLALQEASKEREREYVTLVKRLRERNMMIKMSEQVMAETTEKVNEEIAKATEDKDKEVLSVVTRILAEREQLLGEIDYFKQRISEAQQKLRTGYFEDPEEKKKAVAAAVAEHREGRWADWEDPQKRSSSPRHVSLEKMTRPKGTFSLRCEQPRTQEHDRREQFEARRKQQQTLYEGTTKAGHKMGAQSVSEKRKKVQENRRVITTNVQKTKQLQQMIEKERKEKEMTLLQLRNRLELALSRQAKFQESNEALKAAHKNKKEGVKQLQQHYASIHAEQFGTSAPLQAIEDVPAQKKVLHPDFLADIQNLPTGKDQDSKARRNELWSGMDVNGNGLLSLAEVDKGVRDVLQCEGLFGIKPVLIRAFNASLRGNKKEGLLHKTQFRLLLWYLQEYLGLWQLFEALDTSGDRRISVQEFESALPRLSEWGIPTEDPAALFRELDKDGGGMILFEEFSHWALERGLDLQAVDEAEEAAEEGVSV